MSSTLSEKQAQINLHLREKYMEEIRLRRQERERRRQENLENGGVEEHPKRVDSAGSDDGVHSSGEKAEDDDDLGAALRRKGMDVDDDEDEGMGSMVGAGEKLKDDPDDPSRPESASTEGGKAVEALTDDAESALSLVGKEDDEAAGSVSGYHADAEDEEPEKAEPEAGAEEPEAEPVEPEAEPTEPEEASAEPEAETAEPEEVSAEPETEPVEPETEPVEPEEASAEPEAEAAEPEAEPAETEALSEEPENVAVLAEEENPATETPNPADVEPENGGGAETVPDKPPDTSRRRRKKKIYFDMEKVTANRKPLSIRTTPLAVPVSSKKENENFKPHLKNRYELIQKQNKLKWKAKMQTKPLSQSNASVLIAPTPTVEVSPASEDMQGQLEGILSQVGGDKMKKESFVNPLMDPSMERPVAPHKRKRSDSLPGTKMAVGSGVAVDPKSEVWVPGEDNLYVYSYSSLPRLLHIKRLGGKRVATTFSNDTDPNSSFRLKNRSGRVIRGTNFGKDGAPKWNPYFAYARCLSANDYALSQLDSSVSAEVAVIKALVSNILREAAVEVAAEAEADGAKMEQLAARRLSADGAKNESTEEEVRKDPEGEETPPETTEEEIAPDPPEEEPGPAKEEGGEEEMNLPEPDEMIGKGEVLSEPEEVPAG